MPQNPDHIWNMTLIFLPKALVKSEPGDFQRFINWQTVKHSALYEYREMSARRGGGGNCFHLDADYQLEILLRRETISKW